MGRARRSRSQSISAANCPRPWATPAASTLRPAKAAWWCLGLTAVVPIKDRDAISVIQAKILAGSLAKSLQDEFSHGAADPPSEPRTSCHSVLRARGYFTSAGMGIGFPLSPRLVRHGPRADRRHDAAEHHGLSATWL